jgi:DMSO reductase anchor subunit
MQPARLTDPFWVSGECVCVCMYMCVYTCECVCDVRESLSVCVYWISCILYGSRFSVHTLTRTFICMHTLSHTLTLTQAEVGLHQSAVRARAGTSRAHAPSTRAPNTWAGQYTHANTLSFVCVHMFLPYCICAHIYIYIPTCHSTSHTHI